MTASKPPLSLNAWLRWDIVRRVLDDLEGVETVLEIGAGLGGVGTRLSRRYDYHGLELDPTSFAVARERLADEGRGEVVLGDLSAVDPERTFDLVCAFEVLEHIEDDASALREWTSRIEPRGYLLVSVPAWRHRWGAADRSAGHFRRYDRNDLEQLLVSADLAELRLISYGFPLGYLLQPVWNMLARRHVGEPLADRTAKSGRWFQPPDAMALVTQVVSLPFRLVQRRFVSSSLGTGLVAVARRRD